MDDDESIENIKNSLRENFDNHFKKYDDIYDNLVICSLLDCRFFNLPFLTLSDRKRIMKSFYDIYDVY